MSITTFQAYLEQLMEVDQYVTVHFAVNPFRYKEDGGDHQLYIECGRIVDVGADFFLLKIMNLGSMDLTGNVIAIPFGGIAYIDPEE